MKHSPSREANSHSAIQQIPRPVWDLKAHYRVHNSPPLVPILSHMHPVHTFPPYFPKIHFLLSSHLCLGLPSWIFPPSFPTNIFYAVSICPMRATWPAHLILLDLITLIVIDEANKLRSSSLCSVLQPPATSSLLGSNIPLSTLQR
jgi:hypothetical protein